MLEKALHLKQRYGWLATVPDFDARVDEAHRFAHVLRSAPDDMRLRMDELMWRLPPELEHYREQRDDGLSALATDLPATLVEHVVRARRAVLEESGDFQSPDVDGRLAGFVPDDNLYDGAAAPESKDFFDEANVPAWNYWLALAPHHATGRSLLVTYVPSAFIDLVDRGISVNPEECIFWL